MMTSDENLEFRANPESRPCQFCGHDAHAGACGELYTSIVNGSVLACCCMDDEPLSVLDVLEMEGRI